MIKYWQVIEIKYVPSIVLGIYPDPVVFLYRYFPHSNCILGVVILRKLTK